MQATRTVVGVNVGAAVAAEVPTSAPRVVEHIEVACGVLADASDAGEALVANLPFDSRRGIEITALNPECTGQRRRARELVTLDVHVGAFVPNHELSRRRIEIERRRLRPAGHTDGVQQRAGWTELDDRALTLLCNPDVACAIQCEGARVRDVDVPLPDTGGSEDPDAIAIEVARVEERGRRGQSSDDVDPRQVVKRTDLNQEIASFGGAVASSHRTASIRRAGLQCYEDRRRIARDRAALKLAVRGERAEALAGLVDSDATLVLVPHGGRLDGAFGRDPHGTRGVTHVGGEGAIGVRQPIGGVFSLTGRRNHGDRYSEERSMNPFFPDHD